MRNIIKLCVGVRGATKSKIVQIPIFPPFIPPFRWLRSCSAFIRRNVIIGHNIVSIIIRDIWYLSK